MDMHWVYHPTEGSKIVDSSEYERLMDSGWYDTPANFPVEEVVSPQRKVKQKQK